MLCVGLLGSGCGGDDGEAGGGGEAGVATNASAPAKDIVAQIPGLPLFAKAQAPGTYVGSAGPARNPAVAFVAQDGQVVVYVCDGAKLGDWFGGPIEGGHLDLKSKEGTRVRGTVTQRGVRGVLTLAGGRELTYVALLASRTRPRTGLFLFEDTSSKGATARWIVTPNGVRGISTTATGASTNGLTITRTSSGTQTDSRFAGVNSGVTQLLTQTKQLQAELVAARSE